MAVASFRWILQLPKDVPKAAKFYSEGLDFSLNECTLRWAELRSGPLKLALMQSSKLCGIRFIRRNLAANAYRLNIQRKNFCTNPATNLSRSESSDTAESKNDEEEKLSISGKNHNHDVAIVGGGMVGLALACSLASMPLTKQLKIAIIDSNPALKSGTLVKKDDPPDPRVSTVTPATISFLQDVDAWKYIEQHRHAYFDKMQVWDYTGLGYTRYGARDINKDILGCVVENKVLMSSLFSCLQDKEFPKTIYPSRLASMTIPLSSAVGNTYSGASDELGNLAKLELSDGSSLHAKLVVGADGSKSRVRELAKFKTTGWSYAQNAVICTVEHTIENHCAWQRFLPAGPIALLPMSENYSNIVWTMSPEDATKRLSMSEEDFVKDVNHALDYGYGPHPKPSILGGGDIFSWMNKDSSFSVNEMFEVPPKVVNLASQRMVFPLSLMHSNRYASKRVALIGDAAHTVHPLAGQGVNLGFSDAFALSKVIAEGIELGTDIGEVSLLKKLEVERKASNIAMMAILDGFQKAYSIDFGPLNILRAAAMHGAQYISPLKKTIISYASGDQRLPLFT